MITCEAVAQLLADGGTRAVFGLLGEDIVRLCLELEQRGVTYHGARHENQAVAMADGYSRATGEVGIAFLTGGPGFSNALTAINTAHRARSRVLVVVGSGLDPYSSKVLPHDAVCAGFGIDARGAARAEDAVPVVRDALRDVAAGRTVVLNLPLAVLQAEATEPAPVVAETHLPVPLEPDPERIGDVADLLEQTFAVARPVILAGAGAVRAGARDDLVRLGELTGAVLATSLAANGLFHGDPWNVGISGTYARPAAVDLLRRADCVLAFGASLNRFTTFQGELFPQARVVQVDVNASAFGRFVPVDDELRVVGDVAAVARALVDELERRGHKAQGYRTEATSRVLAAQPAAEGRSTAGLLDPHVLAADLDEILPFPRTLVVDTGHHATFTIPAMRVDGPRSFMQPNDAGSVGLALGAGIGAAVGRPDVTTVVGVGDAGFLMALGDLDTAVRHRLPLVVVVTNDEALGAELHYMDLKGIHPTDISRCATPSLAEVAAGFGAEAHTVRTRADLAALRPLLARRPERPVVLDCRTDPDVRSTSITVLFA